MFFAPIIQEPVQPPKYVTVFVHGTHRTVGLIPKIIKPLYTRFQHKPDFAKASNYPETYCYRKMLTTLSKSAPLQFPFQDSYIFCWSGELSHPARVQAAQDLDTALSQLYTAYSGNLKLTMITHSHGGNVALNLAGLECKTPRNYTIDRLILLACPVQTKTKEYVFSDLFKEIYAPYSNFDFIQVLDPQAITIEGHNWNPPFPRRRGSKKLKQSGPFFSKRHFEKKSPVKHIRISKKFRPMAHIDFLLPSFIKKLGILLETAQTHDFSEKELSYRI